MTHKIIDILGWVLLPVFLAVGVFTSVKFQDPVLMVFVAFFFITGVQAKQANDEFGRKLKDTRKRVEEINSIKW